MLATHRLTVVKLGGSYAASSRLRQWIAAIVRGAGRVVLAPGGGPFADGVRAAQPLMGFGDGTAHHMALLAMEQYGLALAALDDRLAPAATEDAIREALHQQRVPIWMPSAMALGAPDIAESWDVTSDSLAAWLARRLGARRLVLIKQVDVSGPDSIEALSESGIIDPALRSMLHGSGVELSIIGPDALVSAGEAFADGADVGIRIEVR
jgi:5-(aminomethyl)-3-furanmethanol phosphate kinase